MNNQILSEYLNDISLQLQSLKSKISQNEEIVTKNEEFIQSINNSSIREKIGKVISPEEYESLPIYKSKYELNDIAENNIVDENINSILNYIKGSNEMILNSISRIKDNLLEKKERNNQIKRNKSELLLINKDISQSQLDELQFLSTKKNQSLSVQSSIRYLYNGDKENKYQKINQVLFSISSKNNSISNSGTYTYNNTVSNVMLDNNNSKMRNSEMIIESKDDIKEIQVASKKEIQINSKENGDLSKIKNKTLNRKLIINNTKDNITETNKNVNMNKLPIKDSSLLKNILKENSTNPLTNINLYNNKIKNTSKSNIKELVSSSSTLNLSKKVNNIQNKKK